MIDSCFGHTACSEQNSQDLLFPVQWVRSSLTESLKPCSSCGRWSCSWRPFLRIIANAEVSLGTYLCLA
uniref:Uncharacterized protein n=1 Tax=Physcomitrium patens TaxID=3218 RepID=A0A2K1KUJ1_PHYPA|nr:hypothetical protein PHYPA_004451 [Physcomitrium patens]